MEGNNQHLYQLKQDFLDAWPPERVSEMSLEEYTNLNKEDSFTYWVEFKTQNLGGIGGGPAFKFGIYERRNTESELNSSTYKTDGQYAWYAKLGDTAQVAFEEVKETILEIIKAVKDEEYEKIEDIDFGTAVKWKIAFLYSDHEILNFFNREGLEFLAEHLGIDNAGKYKTSELNQLILQQKPASEDYYDFANRLWDIWDNRDDETEDSDDASFTEIKSLFEEDDLEVFFSYLKRFIQDLGLERGDQRIVLSCKRNRLNFMIGQIYCWNIFYNWKKGKYGVISIEPLSENSEMYAGNPPRPYYTFYDSFSPSSEDIDSILEGMEFELNRTSKSGLLKHHNKDFENFIFSDQPTINTSALSKHNLNTILYGPPGTGKTYYTTDLAVQIIKPDDYIEGDHAHNKLIFDELVKQGRVVFTTFHQSMSYEDFVEGIKPKTEDETGQVSYYIEDGIFKRICVEASTPYLENAKSTERQDNLTFTLRFDKFTDDVEEHLEGNEYYPIESKSGNELHILGISSQGNFIVQHENGKREYTVSRARAEKLFNAFPDLTDISNIYTSFREVIGGSNASAYWAVLKKLHSIESNESDVDWKKIDYKTRAKESVKIQWQDHENFRADPYVLIIDEINRGNISAIFGELITLLEEDKRGGSKEHLTAQLPYSKTNFTVPKNLFLIGTMNTADRSVEALDTALRRRFAFEEMMPQPTIIAEVLKDKNEWEGIRISEVLATINDRIELLVDRDHLIGHSYFLSLKEVAREDMEEALIHIFVDKIIPLLQEYFYNDYVKIGMVLGKGFIKIKERRDLRFADFEEQLDADYTEKTIYHIYSRKELRENGFSNALHALLNPS